MKEYRKIFTNGCFDILHRGHLELLEYCRHRAGSSSWPRCGEVIVGLNSDASVKRLKGEGRPINNEKDRKYCLECLSSVDRVIIFDTDTPKRLINCIKPDAIIKGSNDIPEDEEIDGYEVIFFKHKDGYSTTSIINEIFSNRR